MVRALPAFVIVFRRNGRHLRFNLNKMDGSHEAARYGATSRFHTRGQIDRGHRIDVTRVRRALDDSGVTRVNPADVYSRIYLYAVF